MATTIRYAKAESWLGPFVAAMSGKGLVMVEFGDMNEALRARLAGRFPEATLIEDDAGLRDMLDRLAALIERPEVGEDFALDLQGSDFELSVWKRCGRFPLAKRRPTAKSPRSSAFRGKRVKLAKLAPPTCWPPSYLVTGS